MAANIPDMSAIHNLGKQFDTPKNVFDIAQKHFDKKNKQAVRAQVKQAKQTESNRNKFANSATQAVKQGRQQFDKNVQAQAKTMQQQRNFAHGQALNYQAAQFRVQQQQKNYAHGQAIQHQKQMNKKAAKGGPVNTTTSPKAPSLSPSFSNPTPTHTPVKAVGIPQTSFSSQLAPQKPVAKPQGSTTASFSSPRGNGAAKPQKAATGAPVSSQFSHATPVKPKSLTPSFSDKSAAPPRNLNPSFSSGPTTNKPKPSGSTAINFSHGG